MRTIGASLGGTFGVVLGGLAGSTLGAKSNNAFITYAGGQIGSTLGTIGGSSLGASVASWPQLLMQRCRGDDNPGAIKQSDKADQLELVDDAKGSEGGWSGLRFDGPAPSWVTHVWQVFVAYAVYDAMFYWSHRLLHHPSLYKHCHKQHHEYHTPVAISGTHQHLLEGIIQIFNWYVPVAVAGWLNKNHGGLHASTLFYYNCFRWLETMDAHCGHEFPFSPFKLAPFCLGARGHDFHHREFNGNYGAMIFWDRLCGTDAGFWTELKEEGVLLAGLRRPL